MITNRLYQENRKNSPNQGKWYARAIHPQTVETNDLCMLIQRNCTVKKSDVMAVLTELVEVMQDQLQNGARVKLNGFGSFKIGLKSTAADTAADFSAAKHIVGSRVNFQPSTTIDGNHNRRKVFLDGVRFVETPKNTIDTSKPKDDEGE